MKLFKYLAVFTVILFYGYVVMQTGVAAAMVLFIKTLGIVVFGLSHIWIFDMKDAFQTVWRWIKCSSTSLLEFSRRSQSSSS